MQALARVVLTDLTLSCSPLSFLSALLTQLARSTALFLTVRGLQRWATEDAEIKVPSAENLEQTSRSEYSHACFAYCQEFLSCPNFYLPVQST